MKKLDSFNRFVDACSNGDGATSAHSKAYQGEMPLNIGYYVYALVESDTDRIFYVGKGCKDRIHHHLRDAAKGKITNAPKHEAINNLLRRGASVNGLIVEAGLTERQALALEKILIKAIKKQLTNIMNGAQDNYDKLLAEARSYRAQITPFNDWVNNMSIEMWFGVMKDSMDVALAYYRDSVVFWDQIIEKLSRGEYANQKG